MGLSMEFRNTIASCGIGLGWPENHAAEAWGHYTRCSGSHPTPENLRGSSRRQGSSPSATHEHRSFQRKSNSHKHLKHVSRKPTSATTIPGMVACMIAFSVRSIRHTLAICAG